MSTYQGNTIQFNQDVKTYFHPKSHKFSDSIFMNVLDAHEKK